MAQELGSSQASDLAPVVPIAISQCVKPSCKDRSEHPSAASKSVEREDLQGLLVTTLEATTFTSTTSSSEGSKAIYDKVYTKPSRIFTLSRHVGPFKPQLAQVELLQLESLKPQFAQMGPLKPRFAEVAPLNLQPLKPLFAQVEPVELQFA